MTQPEPTTAPAMPTHITRAQLVAACEALGFDPNVTAGFNLTLLVGAEEVAVIQYERNADGKSYLVGNHAAMNTTRIPVAESYEEVLARKADLAARFGKAAQKAVATDAGDADA